MNDQPRDREIRAAELCEDTWIVLVPAESGNRVRPWAHVIDDRDWRQTFCGMDSSKWVGLHPSIGVNTQTGEIQFGADRVCQTCSVGSEYDSQDAVAKALTDWLKAHPEPEAEREVG